MKTINLLMTSLIFLTGAGLANARAQKPCQWDGRFQQVNGDHELKIACEVDDLISFEITQGPESEPIAHFLAVVRGASARMTQPYPDSSCQITLKRLEKNVLVISHCGEPSNDSGLYRPSS